MDPAPVFTRWGDMNTPGILREKARKCRQLAKGADDRTRDNLLMLADSYEAEARKLEPPAPAGDALRH